MCSVCVPYVFCMCSMNVLYAFHRCSRCVLGVFHERSICVPGTFHICSINVLFLKKNDSIKCWHTRPRHLKIIIWVFFEFWNVEGPYLKIFLRYQFLPTNTFLIKIWAFIWLFQLKKSLFRGQSYGVFGHNDRPLRAHRPTPQKGVVVVPEHPRVRHLV